MRRSSKPPIAVLLLPRALEQFILREQAEDLLSAPGVVAVEPGRIPYGAFGRVPERTAARMAKGQARRLASRMPGDVGVVVIFHPLQYPLASELCRRTGAELWYGRWDRYEQAYDAGPALRARLAAWHEAAASESALTFVASSALAGYEQDAGRDAVVVGLSAGSFPAPDPTGTIVAVSLGHLGWRTDWALLRGVAEALGERLVLLLIGDWHEDEVGADEDFRFCRSHPSFVWLGRLDDTAASRVILTADVGIVPFEASPFNEPALPYRILKYARLGRRTVMRDLPGAHTWANAVSFADTAPDFAAALLDQAGRRASPDLDLRAWALEQTAERINEPLRDRLRSLEIDAG